MLLIAMIGLEPLLVRCQVLGAEPGVRGPAPDGLEVQVALILANLVLEMGATILLAGESVLGFVRIVQESLQLGAVGALAGDRDRAAEVLRCFGGPGRERFQLLPARG